jgi:leucyl aminopeptidase
MDLRLIDTPLAHLATPLLAIPLAKGAGLPDEAARLDEAHFGGAMGRALAAGDFRGGEDDSLLFFGGAGSGPARALLVGLGGGADLAPEAFRRAAGRAVRQAERLRITGLTLLCEPVEAVGDELAVQALAEGAALAAWDYRELKSAPAETGNGPAPLLAEAQLRTPALRPELEGALARGRAVAAGQNFARTLQCRPGNVATPTHLAEEARALGREWGMEVTILGPEELRAERMEALLAVSRGSEEEPRMIVVRHSGGDPAARPIALVGKGLTFDAGGISIKPAAGMEEMKFDMSGAAAVLGALRAAAELRLPLNLVGLIPASENLLGGAAMKPGDVIGSRAGKTIEVLNTDAEGRLILADALDYARTFNPAAIVDLATLTGACVVALGKHAAAVLGTDEALIAELRAAGDRAGERCWPLPLFPEYRRQLDSTVADLQNIGGREAGTITAAWFLREFVGDAPWAHLDIAGTAYGTTPLSYQRKGGYGFPVRLLVEWLRSRCG